MLPPVGVGRGLTTKSGVESHGEATAVVVERDRENNSRAGALEGSSGIHLSNR